MHVVSGTLNKAPFIKSGCGPQQDSTMYAVELVEITKDYKTQEKTYANYRAVFFAKTPNAVEFYNKAFSEGSFVVVACEKLKPTLSQCGKYINLEMDNAKLEGCKYPETAQGWGQPQQPAQQQQQRPQNTPQYNEPPMDFDDDIPFGYIGIEHNNNLLHAI